MGNKKLTQNAKSKSLIRKGKRPSFHITVQVHPPLDSSHQKLKTYAKHSPRAQNAKEIIPSSCVSLNPTTFTRLKLSSTRNRINNFKLNSSAVEKAASNTTSTKLNT
ncbi:hypothetical protein Tsubulata_035318 [Turnera subulata]|uniref:Uncharacterized protein n=1 Tax=Turnera subulata TaxID=218843 RepID=A0A9Q0FY74_9ROSI|nr:hypothetical protein Tsubulata_035318 [Turnera subulata]